MLKKGDPAPDFVVGKSSLRRMLEKRAVVVFFFPKAFTPGWTKEAGEFRRRYPELQRSGVDVVGVSADGQETADRFAESLKLPFPLVGDPGGAILKAYKVRWPIVGLARRVSYVVGQDGRVEQAFHSEMDPEAHAAEACAYRLRPPKSKA